MNSLKKILISHRGNFSGPNPSMENKPEYILAAINMGYNVEIDVWFEKNSFYLGHDKPQYKIEFKFLKNKKLWIHCKNKEALEQLSYSDLHYFWHEKDTVTLTSYKYVWAYPGKQPIKNSIAVMPELYNDNISECIGICSDYISNYS